MQYVAIVGQYIDTSVVLEVPGPPVCNVANRPRLHVNTSSNIVTLLVTTIANTRSPVVPAAADIHLHVSPRPAGASAVTLCAQPTHGPVPVYTCFNRCSAMNARQHAAHVLDMAISSCWSDLSWLKDRFRLDLCSSPSGKVRDMGLAY